MRIASKLPIIALLVVWVLLAISSLFAACGGQSAREGQLGQSPPDGRVDWSSFAPLGGPGLDTSNLDELSNKAGFRFVLPSYIPPGISRTFFLSTQVGPNSEGQGSVSLIPDEEAPRDIQIGIQIDEHVRPPGEPSVTGYSSDYDVHRIGGIDVACLTEMPDVRWPTPAPNEGYPAALTCEWETEQLSFRVQFGWRTESGATPEVTPERRDEAIKVITSMIEDPYIP